MTVNVTFSSFVYRCRQNLKSMFYNCRQREETSQMKLGNSELELLKFVQDKGPVSVKAVATLYGEPKGLARTTIHTMMERLRHKGHLTRVADEAGFLYTAKHGTERTLHDSIESFVNKTLGGSIAPIASYFANAKNLKPEEVELLRAVIEEMDNPDGGSK
jgi:predicted transcriptional regulator